MLDLQETQAQSFQSNKNWSQMYAITSSVLQQRTASIVCFSIFLFCDLEIIFSSIISLDIFPWSHWFELHVSMIYSFIIMQPKPTDWSPLAKMADQRNWCKSFALEFRWFTNQSGTTYMAHSEFDVHLMFIWCSSDVQTFISTDALTIKDDCTE